MTIYPEWIKVKCPTCKANPYKECTAVLTLPSGTRLNRPHVKRLRASDEIRIKRESNKDKSCTD